MPRAGWEGRSGRSSPRLRASPPRCAPGGCCATWRDDGEAETGATRRVAAALVHAVEALEDPLEVTGGDADAVVVDLDDRPPFPATAATVEARRCRSRRRTSPRSRAGCTGPTRAGGGHRGPPPAGRAPPCSILTPRLLGGGPHTLDGLGHDQVDQRRAPRGGASSDSMRERSSRSSMILLTLKASVWMRPARRWRHRGPSPTRGSRPGARGRPSGSSARGSRWRRSRGVSPRGAGARRRRR